MDASRRLFLKTGTLAVGATLLYPKDMFAYRATNTILGIQLYSVREDMKRDPEKTLRQLAKMGYTNVEHAGYEDRKFYGYSVSDTKQFLSDIGLQMLSGHSFLGAKQWDKSKNDFTDEWRNTIEDAAAVGMKYVISPGVDEDLCKTSDDFKWYMDLFNKTGELCKNAGITFAYHNESYEFNHKLDNTILYDLLLKLTDKSLVAHQIDIGNMYEPGGRAMDYLKRYHGRFSLMHVKNETKTTAKEKKSSKYESSVLNKGVINVKSIVDYGRKSGITHFIIEQESYQGKTPLECAKEDLKIMKNWGY